MAYHHHTPAQRAKIKKAKRMGLRGSPVLPKKSFRNMKER